MNVKKSIVNVGASTMPLHGYRIHNRNLILSYPEALYKENQSRKRGKDMIDELEKVKIIRPLFNKGRKIQNKRIPVMTKVTEKEIDLNKLMPINIQNVKCKNDNSNKIGLMFTYDNRLNKYWNDPFKYLPVVLTLGAICTPDFSVYSTMDEHMTEHSVYMNRWIGCLWQDHGAIVIPTIQWSTPDTYDICFSGVEKGTIVAISTLGCDKYQQEFLTGFYEMKRRINPPVIIVFGKIIPGITGRIVNYDFKDGFEIKADFEQLILFDLPKIFEIKEIVNNGK